jgi:hypothetical protein
METEKMAKQWDINDFDCHMDLMVCIFSLCLVGINIFHLQNWFFCRRMAEREVVQRQYEATKVAA